MSDLRDLFDLVLSDPAKLITDLTETLYSFVLSFSLFCSSITLIEVKLKNEFSSAFSIDKTRNPTSTLKYPFPRYDTSGKTRPQISNKC